MNTHHLAVLTATLAVGCLGIWQPTRADAEQTPAAPLIHAAGMAISSGLASGAGPRASDDSKPTEPSAVRVIGNQSSSSAASPTRIGGVSTNAEPRGQAARRADRSRIAGQPSRASQATPMARANDDNSAPMASNAASLPGGMGSAAAIPNLDVQVNGNAVIVRDMDSGRVLVDTTNLALWTVWGGYTSTPFVTPSTQIVAKPDGFDIVFNYHNTSGVVRHPGEVRVPGIKMPETFKTRRFWLDCQDATVEFGRDTNSGGDTNQLSYPGAIYAPVAMFADNDYTIGVQLLYSALEYNHSVTHRYSAPPSGGNPRPWMSVWRLHSQYDYDRKILDPKGFLQPGEQRTYTLAVRVVKNVPGDHENRWLQAFTPYRDYFQSVHGGPRYARNPNPVQHELMSIAPQHNNLTNNPRSFTYANTRAMDKFGLAPWANHLRGRMDKGVKRFNLAAFSGHYTVHTQHNWPSIIGTTLLNEPALALARDTMHEFQSIAADGGDICFWWGGSSRVQFGWDTGESYWLDPQNPEHRAKGFAELDSAVMLGASTIGFDAFSRMPAWQGYRWLEDIRARYPDLKFVIEPMPSDFVHTMGSGILYQNQSQSLKQWAVKGPHVLADFLLPGHEIWGLILANPFRESGLAQNGQPIPDSVLRPAAELAAKNGYTPMVFGEPDVRQWDLTARQSWLQSVPADLRK